MEVEDFDVRLEVVGRRGDERDALCPAHNDTARSLSYAPGKNGGVVVKCHAGCEPSAIVQAMGLTLADLMPKARVVAQYDYVRLDGTVAYSVQRWVPKSFRCVPKLPPPAERILYQQSAIAWARTQGVPVYLVEGEKDADRLCALSIPATCNVGGAGKWLDVYSEQLAGVHVIVVADNDGPGRRHARTVGTALRQQALSVKLVVPSRGKDVSELLDAGLGLDALVPLPDAEEVASSRADKVAPVDIRWAWRDHFALGKLSLIEGDPGDGKSLLTVDLAARWSNGSPMPDGSTYDGPYVVILVSAEDDPADTIVPRLLAAGARLEHVYLITHGLTPDVPFDFETGLPGVEALALEVRARIIIFDPLTAFLADTVDSHSDHSVRRALQPLRGLAERTEASVSAVRHLNKGGAGTKAIYRGGGSIAFTGAARSTFLVATDPGDPDVRILACVKSNLARKPPSLRYSIETTAGGVPYVTWRGAVELDAQAVLDGPVKEATANDDELASKRRQRRYEIEFLADILSGGPMAWRDIVAVGKTEGFQEHGLRYARSDIGLQKIFGTAGNRDVTWALPATAVDVQTAPEDQAPVVPLSQKGSSGSPRTKAPENPSYGQVGDEPAPVGPDGTTDADRDYDLDQMPLRCTICYTGERVERYYRPYWVVRCREHDPRKMEPQL